MDNARGYEQDNLVKSCWFCNSIKGSLLTHADMHLIAGPVIARLSALVKAADENANRSALDAGMTLCLEPGPR